MQINNDTHICFSIISTGKCNCNCSYCHFYADKDRNAYNRDISPELSERYINYLKYLKDITPHISCRLSGGEPLFMGDSVFQLTDKIANETGINPYIMTNGKLLSPELIERAYEHHISSFVVSVENPFAVSKGAIDTNDTIKKFVTLQNEKAPLYFGMLVLENSQYKNIKKIADYFYEKTGTLPPMCEVNFVPYKSPTDEELNDLYTNVKALVKEYNGKAPISLFPYIIPEYYSGNLEHVEYLTELPLDDKFDSLNKTNEELLQSTQNQLERSYFKYTCEKTDCDWYNSCNRLKWVWQMDTDDISREQKINDYCRYKKTLSQAFFDALVDNKI